MPKAAQHHALARQWQLLKLLPSRPPGISSRDLAARLADEGFKVTKRTVERDLAELSSIFGIACNDKGMPYGWHWMKGEYADLPGLSISDALSLRLVEDLLRPLLPVAVLTALETRFIQARMKLTALAPLNPQARLAEKVRYVQPTLPLLPPNVDAAVLDNVHEALAQERQIEVDYRKPSGEVFKLALHPLALIQRGQITYLVATAFDYQDIRLYAAHRILAVTPRREPATIPAGFSVDVYAASGAAEFGNGNTIALEAWISEELASILHETPLATTQQIAHVGERNQLKATLSDSWQLRWWLLGQGARIEVVAPSELRQWITQELNIASAQYETQKE